MMCIYAISDRSDEKLNTICEYLRACGMLRNYGDPSEDPVFSRVVTLDLATIVSSVSGPKRPHDRVQVSDMKTDFRQCLTNKVIYTLIHLLYSIKLPFFSSEKSKFERKSYTG